MKWSRFLYPPLALLSAFACRETSSPRNVVEESLRQPIHVRWSVTSGPVRFIANAADGESAVVEAATAKGHSVKETDVKFWVVKGVERQVQIDYLERGTGGLPVPKPFARFTVPEDGLDRYPNGLPIAPGDSVLVTLSVHPRVMSVRLEPRGLRFSTRDPARLQMWYLASGGDLNADGAVDASDAELERVRLGIWMQETSGEWNVLWTLQSLRGRWLRTTFEHASDFALAASTPID